MLGKFHITLHFLYTSFVAIAIKYRLLNVAEVVSTSFMCYDANKWLN